MKSQTLQKSCSVFCNGVMIQYLGEQQHLERHFCLLLGKHVGVWSSRDPQSGHSLSVFGLLCSSFLRIWPDWSPCFSRPRRLPWGWALWRGRGGSLEHPMILGQVGCGERGCGVLPMLPWRKFPLGNYVQK